MNTSSVTNGLYKLLSEGTLVGSTVHFVNGQEQLQVDTTQYIISEVISRARSRWVIIYIFSIIIHLSLT